MGGFNYGGKGDGTGWSSERGDGTWGLGSNGTKMQINYLINFLN